MKDTILVLIVAALFALVWVAADRFRIFGAKFRGNTRRPEAGESGFVFPTAENSSEEIAEAIAHLRDCYGPESVTVHVDDEVVPFDRASEV